MSVLPASEAIGADRRDLAVKLFCLCALVAQVAWLAFLLWLPFWVLGLI